MKKHRFLLVLLIFCLTSAELVFAVPQRKPVQTADAFKSYQADSWLVSTAEEPQGDISETAPAEADIKGILSCFDGKNIRFDIFLHNPVTDQNLVTYGVVFMFEPDIYEHFTYDAMLKNFYYKLVIGGKTVTAKKLKNGDLGHYTHVSQDKKCVYFILDYNAINTETMRSGSSLMVAFYTMYYLNVKTPQVADKTSAVLLDCGPTRTHTGNQGPHVSTLAGRPGEKTWYDGPASHAMLSSPAGLTIDTAGNIYFIDKTMVRKLSTDGMVTTVTDGSSTAEVSFYNPSGITVDSSGNLYVSDSMRHMILKITPQGKVIHWCGSGIYGSDGRGHADGSGKKARFSYPHGITIDSAGNLYVAESGSPGNSIRKITPEGMVSTLYGPQEYGYRDGKHSVARFYYPTDIAVDADGNLYINDDYTIRKMTPDGTVTTLAGKYKQKGYRDGVGTKARFGGKPWGLTVDEAGNVYVADTGNKVIRKVAPDGTVTTVAGKPGVGGNANGPLKSAVFQRLSGLAIGPAGNLYVTDSDNQAIKKIILE